MYHSIYYFFILFLIKFRIFFYLYLFEILFLLNLLLKKINKYQFFKELEFQINKLIKINIFNKFLLDNLILLNKFRSN